MRFVAGESIDRQIVELLRLDGHEVRYVAEMNPEVSDREVLNLANNEQAVLLTADKDFGEFFYRQGLVNPGVILLRLAGLPPVAKPDLVSGAANARLEGIAGDFVVISRRVVRIRRRRT